MPDNPSSRIVEVRISEVPLYMTVGITIHCLQLKHMVNALFSSQRGRTNVSSLKVLSLDGRL